MAAGASTVYRVRVHGGEAKVRAFLAAHPLESQRVMLRDGRVQLDLTVDRRQLEALLLAGLTIERRIDVYANLLGRRKEVEPADRFDLRRLPAGIGRLLRG